jgi:hypothetical protein
LEEYWNDFQFASRHTIHRADEKPRKWREAQTVLAGALELAKIRATSTFFDWKKF